MKDFICPFTGLIIPDEEITNSSYKDIKHIYYKVPSDLEKPHYFSLCITLYHKLEDNDDVTFRNSFDKIRPILLFEHLQGNLKKLGGHTIHWDCNNAINKSEQLVITEIMDELLNSGKYPINRTQKVERLIQFIYDNQTHEGKVLKLVDSYTFWGNLFFKNFDELLFYIEELQNEGLVVFNEDSNSVRLTFKGLDHMEQKSNTNIVKHKIAPNTKFDIGLSFAGEQREFVEKVAMELRNKGVKVFYDKFEQTKLWGKDLYQHLNDVYKNKCRFCIVFLSEDYERKLWTKHELKAAQTKAFEENEEYILPVKFDQTEIPGINRTTGYLSTDEFTPEMIANMAYNKLKLEN